MPREAIVNEVKRILCGPINGDFEVLDKSPLDFYTTGILFPQLSVQTTIVDSSGDITDSDSSYFANNEDETEETENETQKKEKKKNLSENQVNDEIKSTSEDDFALSTQFRPSASGISVLINKIQNIKLSISFGTYEKVVEKVKIKNKEGQEAEHNITKYRRKGVNREGTLEIFENEIICQELILVKKNGVYSTTTDFNDKCQIKAVIRNYSKSSDKQILTITLVNTSIVDDFKNQKNSESCIFQPTINLLTKSEFLPFDDFTDLSVLDNEEINLKLLYRNYKSYGMGHGVSVNWNLENGSIQNVYSQVIPEKDVNGVETDPKIFKESKVLFMKNLSGNSINDIYEWENVKQNLIDFIQLYKNWIEGQKNEISKLKEKEFINQAHKNIDKCELLFKRMSKGISILSENKDARKSFEDSNRAMFMQRTMADFSNHRRNENRVLSNDETLVDKLPTFSEVPYNALSGIIWDKGKLNLTTELNIDGKRPLARWRPFQLAFILSQIEGITNPESEDRNTVDLIWFPTGGGKTEAYLGLIAMTIFYRRLNAKKLNNNPDNGAGVTVLMRYTLRLLNKQQFERASILICACELIRTAEPIFYGTVRITNGIWMGSSMTPNKIETQTSDYNTFIKAIKNGTQPNEFKTSPPLLSCPCCGNRLIKEKDNNVLKGRWGYIRPNGPRNKPPGANVPFSITCTNSKCDFHTSNDNDNFNSEKTIPVFEVDEIIYNERPSLLFGTVDKFVALAWKEEAFNLFNLEIQGNEIKRKYPAPELIIQDELHLISSSLGTIYGVYEIAIDHLCKNPAGHITKIIGATATVKNAEEQTKRLYARKNFMQFPPPAISADDSFYSVKKNEDNNARKYIGFMPSGITTSTALIRLTSVLLERIPALSEFNNKEIDPYYTLVVYFNALKELGKFRTFLTDDIVAYRKLLSRHFNTFYKPYNHDRLCELSSVMSSSEITKGLDRLEKTCLQSLNDSEIIKYLQSIGIRNLKDVEIGSTDRKKFLTNKSFFSKLNINYIEDESIESNKKNYSTLINKLKEIGLSNDNDPIQIAPATNMISVGVDVPRLNTLIVNGQPKTTAEYIQSSSRVGREKPGVVFTFLAPTKNRDRSHYEQFVDFHQAYYKYVESSSVTPFSKPALEKVLPTVLITLCKGLFLKCKSTFKKDADFENFLSDIITDIKSRVPVEAYTILDSIYTDFIKHITDFQLVNGRSFAKYDTFGERIGDQYVRTLKNRENVYNAPAEFVDTVLMDHLSTLSTLRNVESSSDILIK